MRMTSSYSFIVPRHEAPFRFGRVRAKSAENCGDGAGGFQPGNTCGQERGPGSDEGTPSRSRGKDDPRTVRTPRRETPSRRDRAELPAATRVTDRDLEAARQTPSIPHPESDEDVARFVAQVKETPVYQAVEAKIQALADDSPGGNPTLWTLGKHVDGDVIRTLKEHGHEAYEHLEWSPERRALHEKILTGMLNPRAEAQPGEKPKLVMLFGPPGSGKTTAGQPVTKKLGVEFTVVNADDVKAQLPEYEGWNAAAVHEESSLLAEGPLTKRALENRHHILMDLTGGNTAKMEQMADEMHRQGYEVHVVSIDLPAYKSTGRAWDRFTKNAFGFKDPTGDEQEIGRFVPPEYIHQGIDGKPERTYRQLKEKPYIKSYISISTDVPRGEKPRVLDRGGQEGG